MGPGNQTQPSDKRLYLLSHLASYVCKLLWGYMCLLIERCSSGRVGAIHYYLANNVLSLPPGDSVVLFKLVLPTRASFGL